MSHRLMLSTSSHVLVLDRQQIFKKVEKKIKYYLKVLVQTNAVLHFAAETPSKEFLQGGREMTT